MSKILRAMLLSAYFALFIQYLQITLIGRNKDSVLLEYIIRTPKTYSKLLKDIKKHGINATMLKMSLNFDRPNRFPTDLKFILKWTEAFLFYSQKKFSTGQKVFIENRCNVYNCYMTNDKNFLVDIRHFDAVLFDVENNWYEYPILRDHHQKFIFTASEAASNHPICQAGHDAYYNLSWTYRLDSDIRWSFLTILDKKNNVVGPNINMKWIDPMKPTSETVLRRLVHKKKAVAWFVSNCKTPSKREKVASKLSEALAKHNLKIDIYGWCGHLKCEKNGLEECFELLEEDYYFYLAFENSISEDYVTEKILTALLHYTVPIVLGGANYSRYLPHGSYINAGDLNATEVAIKINEAMNNFTIYYDYFRWHNHYVYQDQPVDSDVCRLCEILNDPNYKPKVINNFRKWWHPEYEKECNKSTLDNFIHGNGGEINSRLLG